MQLTRSSPHPQDRLIGTVEPTMLPTSPGIEAQFTAIVERVKTHALNRAEKILENSDDALDAFSAAIGKTWTIWRTLTPEEMSDAYLHRAIDNEVIAIIRYRMEKETRLVSLEDAQHELEELAFAAIEQASRHEQPSDKLDAVIAAMPRRRRQAVLLAHVYNFQYHEIAEMLGLSIGTVNTHMRLASKEIRAAFGGHFRLGTGDQHNPPRLRLTAGEDSNV
jgi:RNA polymerase sigma factor (sigma-70 family)